MSIQNSSRSAQSGDSVKASAALYERSCAALYGISAERFATILDEILRKNFSQNARASVKQELEAHKEVQKKDEQKKEVRKEEHQFAFCDALHLEELALAQGCAAGNDRAWQDFISRYRQKLHRMALHITRDATHAEELADSLFADLYGVNLRDGARISKLLSYTGRGSLEGWLRTVMAQEFINRYRKQKRMVSLEEQTEEGAQFAAPAVEPARTSDGSVEAAIDEALSELSSEDKFTLAAYYLDGRTLAEIARLLGLHESSISRRLDRLTSGLRKRILAGLRTRGMSHAQAAEALATDVRDLGLDLRTRLTQDSERKSFPEGKAPAQDAGDGYG